MIFFLHKVVELVVVNPMSLRSSKTESGCSSFCRFSFGVSASFTGPEIAGQELKIVGLTGFSRTGEWVHLYFSLDFCQAFCSKIAGLAGFSWC
jgi:hypothetical protein